MSFIVLPTNLDLFEFLIQTEACTEVPLYFFRFTLLKHVISIGFVDLLYLLITQHVSTLFVLVVYLCEPVLQEITIFDRSGIHQKIREDFRMVGKERVNAHHTLCVQTLDGCSQQACITPRLTPERRAASLINNVKNFNG